MLLFSLFLFGGCLFIVNGQQYAFTVAPNLMRVNHRETVLVNLLPGCPQSRVTVTLLQSDGTVIDREDEELVRDNEGVASRTFEIFVNPRNIPEEPEDEGEIQYLILRTEIHAIGHTDEKQVMLSHQSGYVFIQTDKPIYTPTQKVNIRVMSLDQDAHILNSQVRVEVRTPQDVLVFRKDKNPRDGSGFTNLIFTIPDEPMFGNWTVTAHYGPELKANTSVQFEIKEYVLPTFSVKITPPRYILPNSPDITFLVAAEYIYGKPVQGNAYIRVGVLEHDGGNTEIFRKPKSLTENGECAFEFSTADLDEGWFDMYNTLRLQAVVTVIEEATGKMENASDISARFVSSPFHFVINRTMKYFKKGLPIPINVDVLYPNGDPVHDVEVQVVATATLSNGQEQQLQGNRDTPTLRRTNQRGQVDFRLDVPSTAAEIEISLQTGDVGDAPPASLNFRLTPYNSNGKGYIHIRPQEEELLTGEAVSATVYLNMENTEVNNLHYLVVAQGQILSSGSQYGNVGVIIENLVNFPLKAAMVPFSRLVVYYIADDGSVVVDSVLLEAFRRCENEVTLTVPDRDLVPGEAFNLEVEANPNTEIGLLVVDKAVYLLRSYHQLTREKLFKRFEEYDLGCGRGSGATSAAVFEDSGLVVMTNANLEVARRQSLKCPHVEGDVARRKRSLYEQLAQYDPGTDEHFVCQRGQRITRRRCDRRVELMKDLLEKNGKTFTDELEVIFLACCEAGEHLSRGRSNFFDSFDNIEVNPDEVQFRSDFRETWEFHQFTVGENGRYSLPMQTPDSITDWSFQAVGISSDYSMCVAKHKDLKVFKKFFIQLTMPYSVVRNEEVEILATVFNYHSSQIKVLVSFLTGDGLCSESEPNVPSEVRQLIIPPSDAVSVRFVVIPIKEGKHVIEAAAYALGDSDGIRKELTVEPEGVLRVEDFTVLLDPANIKAHQNEDGGGMEFTTNIQNDGLQVNKLHLQLPENYVPGSEKCKVNIIGTVMGPVVQTVLEDFDRLIRAPRGCGEQTMIYTSPNIYVLKYLTDTGTITPEQRETLVNNIQAGYLREQNYRLPSGAFSAFSSRPGSTWLTAFVAKVFCLASEFINVDPQVTCGALDWIKDNRQNSNGQFEEQYPVIHQEMIGGLRGDGGVSMSAYVLSAFLTCGCRDRGHERAIARGIDYLVYQAGSINRAYTAAVVTYALALGGSEEARQTNQKLFEFSTNDRAASTVHWKSADPSRAVEIAGYAVLSQLALNANDRNFRIVKWMTEQQGYTGSSSTTQDTVISLEALSAYASRGNAPDLNLHCTVNLTSSGHGAREYPISLQNALLQREVVYKSPDIQGDLVVNTTGTGTGRLAAQLSYNVVPDANDVIASEECAFSIRTSLQEGRGDQADKISISVCTRYLKGEQTGMAILDVGIFSGYQPIEQELKAIVADESIEIARYEKSQRSVVFYFDRIINQECCVNFHIESVFKVSNIQPVPVTVYDYYKPTVTCTKFYKPLDGSVLLNPICEGRTCMCASASCSSCEKLSSEQLTENACQSAASYAYEVEIANTTHVEGFFVFAVRIVLPVKKGNDDVIESDTRLFWIRNQCQCPQKSEILPGKRFIIIGTKYLPISRNGVPSAKYYLDGGSFMEYFPGAPPTPAPEDNANQPEGQRNCRGGGRGRGRGRGRRQCRGGRNQNQGQESRQQQRDREQYNKLNDWKNDLLRNGCKN